MATQGSQHVTLCACFNPLSNDRQAHTVCQRNHCPGDCSVVWVHQDIAYESLVDLELVQRQALEIREGGVTGAKVVQRKADADGFQRIHLGYYVLDAGDQHTFSNFQLETMRIGTGELEHRLYLFDKTILIKLPSTDVDGDGQVRELRSIRLYAYTPIRPYGQLLTSYFEHLLA